MSASDKKRLRKEQNAAKMTARQTQAQKEAKQLKRYTISFIAIMVVIVLIAGTVLGVRGVVQSGHFQKKSIAALVNGNELNAVELSYYYFDAIDENYSEWYDTYGENTELYLEILMNLKLSEPLDEQIYDKETGETWSERFISVALENAKHTYVLCALAEEAKFELPVEKKEEIDRKIATLSFWSAYYGYSSIEKYLGSTYCYGATLKNYREYLEKCELADAYYAHYTDSLEYTNEQIRDYEKDKVINYSSFSYGSVYLSYTYFLGEGTKDEKGNVTYTDEERNEARAKAKAAAEALLTNKTFEDLEKAVKEMEINKDKTVVSAINNKNTLQPGITATIRDWVTSADRQKGDNTVITNEYIPDTEDKEGEDGEGDEGTENTTQAQDEDKDSTEDPVINGYYVVLFDSSCDNKVPMVDVRHLLVKFVDDKNDNKKDDNGKVIYTDEEKATAKKKADDLIKKWEEMEGGKTLENFIKLVQENSEDTASKSSGGLFEMLTYDQNYVEPFLNWSLDETRKADDVEIIETEYGYHIMYFVKTHELNYRDYMITENMRVEDAQEWYDGIIKDIAAEAKDLYWLELDRPITR